MIDVTITIAGLHDRTACDLLEFLRCYCKCFQSFGSKQVIEMLLHRCEYQTSIAANNRLLGFDLSLIGEWILFEEISVVVRVKDNY